MAAWLTLCGFGIVFTLPSTAQTGNNARALFAEGVRLEKSGDLAGARASYEAALAADPALIPAMANLGMVELRTGRPADAAKRFRLVLDRSPHLTQVEFFLALALFESGKGGEAAGVLEAYQLKNPGDARVPHLLGLCLMQADRLREGEQQLVKAVAANPANLSAAVSLATAHIALGQLDEADRLFAGPLKGQDAPEALLAQGMLYNARGRHLDARTMLRLAADKNPRLPGLHNQLGYTAMLLGDDPEAVREFERELSARPGDFQANANLGWILLRDRKFTEAQEALARALRTKPDHPGALFLQGQLFFQTGETEKAREALERVVAAQPAFRAAYVLLARSYGKLNRSGDVRRTQAIIQRLTQEEQIRNAGRNDSYGGQSGAPDLSAVAAGALR